jgi:deoxyribonuclease-4
MRAMLIGAHVSPAGGVAKAVERGIERGCHAIQIFNQNPRAWKPREYPADEIEAFHAAMDGSDVDALLIHAVYLLNCASDDPVIRQKSLDSLISSLRAGNELNAAAVVLHPGSAKTGDVQQAIARAGEVIKEALDESETCPLHLENTAGSGGTLGRSFAELAALIDAAGGDERIGICLDSCHLLASGYDIRTEAGLTETLEECVAQCGLERLGSLHLNDSQTPLGSNVDRHADPGEGELGPDGCAVFLSEPRFQDLPLVLEASGPDKKGASAAMIEYTRRLREEGLAKRGAPGS